MVERLLSREQISKPMKMFNLCLPVVFAWVFLDEFQSVFLGKEHECIHRALGPIRIERFFHRGHGRRQQTIRGCAHPCRRQHRLLLFGCERKSATILRKLTLETSFTHLMKWYLLKRSQMSGELMGSLGGARRTSPFSRGWQMMPYFCSVRSGYAEHQPEM